MKTIKKLNSTSATTSKNMFDFLKLYTKIKIIRKINFEHCCTSLPWGTLGKGKDKRSALFQ